MGLNERRLTTITKPFSFLNHCNVPCDSPCCQSLCGENNHCICNTDTHENVNSDSDEDTDNNISELSKLVHVSL